MTDLVSNCCGAEATDPIMEDIGICPECKEHCEFINLEEEEQNESSEK